MVKYTGWRIGVGSAVLRRISTETAILYVYTHLVTDIELPHLDCDHSCEYQRRYESSLPMMTRYLSKPHYPVRLAQSHGQSRHLDEHWWPKGGQVDGTRPEQRPNPSCHHRPYPNGRKYRSLLSPRMKNYRSQVEHLPDLRRM